MNVYQKSFRVPVTSGHRDLLSHFCNATSLQVPDTHRPVRFFVTRVDDDFYLCDVAALAISARKPEVSDASIFDFRDRIAENADEFNVVLLIPTGIGAEIGGHAGDATPVAQLLAETCDHLVLHPNVVNASDINELPRNALYVEGSVISRLLAGTAAIQRVRSNRVLAIVDGSQSDRYVHAALNTIDGARATYGLDCETTVLMKSSLKMKAHYTSAGLAAGSIENLESLFDLLDSFGGDFDAIALTSVIDVPVGYHAEYFQSEGNMVNPWGGVEALLTHAVSTTYGVPTAHAPMMESDDVANMDTGRVDPRMAAESISMSFFNCVLKGLKNSPRILLDQDRFFWPGVLSAEDISCLVIPDGCLGLPTLAALRQKIPVIAVEENSNLMNNDLSLLPWADRQFYRVGSYLEAAGLMLAMRAGLSIKSVKRPIHGTNIAKLTTQVKDRRSSEFEISRKLTY